MPLPLNACCSLSYSATASDFLEHDHQEYHISWINVLWPSDVMWRHRSGLILALLVACFLTAPSHYLHQCAIWFSGSHLKPILREVIKYQFVKWVWKTHFWNYCHIYQGPMKSKNWFQQCFIVNVLVMGHWFQLSLSYICFIIYYRGFAEPNENSCSHI